MYAYMLLLPFLIICDLLCKGRDLGRGSLLSFLGKASLAGFGALPRGVWPVVR